MQPLQIDDLPAAIRAAKQELRKALPNYRQVFAEVEEDVKKQGEIIAAQRARGESVIPELSYADIARQSVRDQTIALIKSRGACVVRRVFSPELVAQWDAQIADYVDTNNLDERLLNRAEDKYFGNLASSRPQIYGVYWSKPQVAARQAPELTATRVFLNRLWKAESEGRKHFDPDHVPVYADRLRRRPPGSESLGLSAHCDGGSVERWLEEKFMRVHRHGVGGTWKQYDPFDATYPPDLREVPAPALFPVVPTLPG